MSTTAHPSPEKLMQYSFGFVATQAQQTALELELFTHVHQGAHDVGSLAAACGATERGVQMLVEALAAMELVTYEGGTIGLTPSSEMFLVKTSQAYMGALALQMENARWRWHKLTDIIRTGKCPDAGVVSDEDNGAFFIELVPSLFALNFPAAQFAAARLGKAERVLDIGAGSGVWGLAFLKAYPDCKLVEQDRQPVIDAVGKPYAERMGVADRVDYLPGSFRDVDFGQEAFDVAILGHILHGEGMAWSKKLLARLHAALKPGGSLLVCEFIPDEERNKNISALFFGLNMLANTEEGCVFTRSELEAMAREAGFTRVDWLEDAPAQSPLAVFRK